MFTLLRRAYLNRTAVKDHEPISPFIRFLVSFSIICGAMIITYFLYLFLYSPSDSLIYDQYAVSKATSLRGIEELSSSFLTLKQEQEEEVEIKEDPYGESITGCLQTIPEVDYGPHIVQPPSGPVTLVCCQTTKGPLNIAIHKTWAPIGAENFLNMIRFGFFSSKVALFRALPNFLIQFGLAGDPKVQRIYEEEMNGELLDDKQWLPSGPPGRNIDGVARFQKGYISYAGAGPNTRGTQLFITNDESDYLGGGSPWEVPFGQLVGDESYDTIVSVYTGYGEAPSQGKIRNRGNAYLEKEFPLLDYILSCDIMAEDLPWKYVERKR